MALVWISECVLPLDGVWPLSVFGSSSLLSYVFHEKSYLKPWQPPKSTNTPRTPTLGVSFDARECSFYGQT